LLRNTEHQSILEDQRKKIAEELHEKLMHDEFETHIAAAREDLRQKAFKKVFDEEHDDIRENVFNQITKEEYERADVELRSQIILEEKKRIVEQESEQLRRDVVEQLKIDERENMVAAIKGEIYSETVHSIKLELDDKYKVVVEEKMAALKSSLAQKAKSEISNAIRLDYDALIEKTDHLSASLTNIEALQSLSQTLSLLTDEKKKYKYLNLNSAQTESLMEYLKRIHNRFNIFFDKIDESIRELMLSLGSVKNKLDNKEYHDGDKK